MTPEEVHRMPHTQYLGFIHYQNRYIKNQERGR